MAFNHKRVPPVCPYSSLDAAGYEALNVTMDDDGLISFSTTTSSPLCYQTHRIITLSINDDDACYCVTSMVVLLLVMVMAIVDSIEMAKGIELLKRSYELATVRRNTKARTSDEYFELYISVLAICHTALSERSQSRHEFSKHFDEKASFNTKIGVRVLALLKQLSELGYERPS
jgi:hypothetical protein